jgi:hypothetical protein
MATGRRDEIPRIAAATGWAHEDARLDGGKIIRDLFSSDVGQVRAVWVVTEWTSTGRFAGAVFSDRRQSKDRNAWSLRGARNSLESFLREAPVGG